MPPVVHSPRRIAVALREPLKEEIDTLIKQGIIAKVYRPTYSVNSGVCVSKPKGKLWLCLGPKDPNTAIKTPHHNTPTLDDVLPKLIGAQFFTILDARTGYWNIKLDEENSYYTTLNTSYGRHMQIHEVAIRAELRPRCIPEEGWRNVQWHTWRYWHIGRQHRCRLQVRWKRSRCESDSSTGASSNHRFMLQWQEDGHSVHAHSVLWKHHWCRWHWTRPRKGDRNMQHYSADGCQGITPHLATVSAPLRDLYKPNVLRLGNRTWSSIFKLEERHLL